MISENCFDDFPLKLWQRNQILDKNWTVLPLTMFHNLSLKLTFPKLCRKMVKYQLSAYTNNRSQNFIPSVCRLVTLHFSLRDTKDNKQCNIFFGTKAKSHATCLCRLRFFLLKRDDIAMRTFVVLWLLRRFCIYNRKLYVPFVIKKRSCSRWASIRKGKFCKLKFISKQFSMSVFPLSQPQMTLFYPFGYIFRSSRLFARRLPRYLFLSHSDWHKKLITFLRVCKWKCVYRLLAKLLFFLDRLFYRHLIFYPVI